MSGKAEVESLKAKGPEAAKHAWLQAAVAADLLLSVLASGQARFEPATHEFCFGGLRYSCRDREWRTLAKIIGLQKLMDAATSGGRRAS